MSEAVVARAAGLLEMIEGKWTTQAIGVAAELGIADHLAAGTDDGSLDRCERRVGDFFAAVPADADVSLMKSILHNWDDASGGQILDRCREAMGADAVLLLVERVLPPTLRGAADERPITRSDLNMLVGFSGRERTLADFDALLGRSGFALQSCRALALGYSLIEAR